MRFASVWVGALLGSAIAVGCAAEGADEYTVPDDTSPTRSTTIDATLAFEGGSSIDVAPGETRAITVFATPGDAYELYFALIDAPPDASLDASYVITGKDGAATVKLHAPSTPASFTLRVWIPDGPTAELSISVSTTGVGVVQVVPDYGGQRAINEWVGSVIVGATCSDIAAELPGEPKGALVAVSAAQENPVIQSVPVGPKLAVEVRAGHFAWGCTDAQNITTGGTTKVKVHVVDVAPVLKKTNLDVALTYAPDAVAYGDMLQAARYSFLDAFLPPQAPEAESLLDTMTELSSDPAAFSAARVAGGWDTLAYAHFAQLPTSLTSRMNGWIDTGFSSAAPIVNGRLAAIDGVPGKAMFLASEIGGFDAASAGAPPVHLVAWTSQPDDKVLLSGTLFWLPSKLAGAACEVGAAEDLGVAGTMADALAKTAACSDFAAALGGFDQCDVTCLASLCKGALWSRWHDALDASAVNGVAGTIDIDASGHIKVDDVAVPIALEGSWIGSVSDGETTASASGMLSGILAQDDGSQPPSGGNPPM